MKEDIKTNIHRTLEQSRSVFIGAKVSPLQKEHIKSLAEQCGMTVSDYLLARAYNFKPKQDSRKKKLHCCRIWTIAVSDLVKYTSALHGMSTKQHMDVQSDSIYGELAEGTWQCGRKCLPVPKFRKRKE